MDALGLLGEAQSTASKIPYENIAAGQKSIGMALNAFHMAADTNLKKQQIEKQLAAMQADMFYKNQAHDLDMQQFGWKQKMDVANLNRQYAADEALAVYRDKTASRLDDKLTWDIGRADAEQENAGAYRNELTALIQKYPDTYQNQEFQNELSIVQTKYSGVAGTKAGKVATSDFFNNIKTAQSQAHWSADQVRKNFNASVQGQSAGGRGFGAEDYARPEDAFREIDGKKVISEYPIMVPGTTTVGQWGTIPPGDPRLKLPESEQTALGIRSRSVPINTYNSTKALRDTMVKIGGTDLSQKPAAMTTPAPSQSDIAYLKIHPEQANRFEARFGTGSASQYLGQ